MVGQCLFTFFLSLRNSSCECICFDIFLSQGSRLVCFRRATDFPRLGTEILLCCPGYFQSGNWEVTLLVELFEASPLPRASKSLCSVGYSSLSLSDHRSLQQEDLSAQRGSWCFTVVFWGRAEHPELLVWVIGRVRGWESLCERLPPPRPQPLETSFLLSLSLWVWLLEILI